MQDTAAVEVRQLLTDELRPNDYNPNRMTKDEFAELVEEVRHLERLPKPVVVRAVEDGYLIVDGEHGWRAAVEVGLAEVACEVIEADDFEAMRQTYKRNQHGTHDRGALGQMFRRMMEEREISNRQLAEEINVSEGTVRNALVFAEAVELRKRYAPEKGARDDYWFEKMTTQQARDYVRLPDGLRDRWLNAGAPATWQPDTWGMSDQGTEDIDWYTHTLVETGIVKVFERGSWGESAKKAYELMVWRQEHRRLIGEDIDAYIRPVVELHPKSPTPVQILERLPIHDGRPFLTPEEWAEALRVAWDKGEKVYEMLGLFRDIAKLKAGEADVPVEDLEDPRVALMKMEVEQDAPGFIRIADIPLADKRFLTHIGTGGGPIWSARNAEITDQEILAIKRQMVKDLAAARQRSGEERKAYEAWLSGADLAQLAASLTGAGGGRPPYPTGVKRAEDLWDRYLNAYLDDREAAAQDKAAAEVLSDPEKTIKALVAKLTTAAPKAFGQKVNGQPAAQVLEERLRAVPRPELVLMAAVLLKTPVTAWLGAVRDEEGGAP